MRYLPETQICCFLYFYTLILASINDSWLKQILLWWLPNDNWVHYSFYIYLEFYCKEEIFNPLPHSFIHSFFHSNLDGFRDSYFILLVIICYSVIYSLSQIFLDGGHWESLKLAFWCVSIIFWEFSYFLAPQNVLGFSCTFSCPSLESLISSRPGSFFLENDILEI